MNFADALKTVKEFFLEFLGFFLPGFIFLLIVGITLTPEFVNEKMSNTLVANFDRTYLLIFVSYIIGYMVYGMDLVREHINKYASESFPKIGQWFKRFFNIVSRRDIENQIEASPEYKITKELVNSTLSKDPDNWDLRFNGYRNFAMSDISQSEVNVIHTFMFRYDLCSNLSLVTLVCSFSGIILTVVDLSIKNLEFKAVNTSWAALFMYFVLLISSYFLEVTSKRFLAISLKVAFPMFLAKKYFKSKLNET